MLTICWASKGGSGTTVVACALALLYARREPSWLIDLAGDAPAALGLAEPVGPGIHDWVATASAAEPALTALSIEATAGLRLIPRGSTIVDPTAERWSVLGTHLASLTHNVVVDAGTLALPPSLAAAAQHRLLVTRPCYLALRRSVADAHVAPTGVVVVHEPGRALRSPDIAYAVQAPVVAEITIDPAVARAVDAGLLVARLPRSLAGPLDELVA